MNALRAVCRTAASRLLTRLCSQAFSASLKRLLSLQDLIRRRARERGKAVLTQLGGASLRPEDVHLASLPTTRSTSKRSDAHFQRSDLTTDTSCRLRH